MHEKVSIVATREYIGDIQSLIQTELEELHYTEYSMYRPERVETTNSEHLAPDDDVSG